MGAQLFAGTVRHRRFHDAMHEFSYSLFMFYFNVADPKKNFKELPTVSCERFNWFSFRRKHYLTNTSVSLDQNARDLIKEKTGSSPAGKIYTLTHLSCLGFCYNPISLYFVFKENTEELEYVIVEVTNTPWGETHQYVLDQPKRPKPDIYQYQFKKVLHVSPFLEMDYDYRFNVKISNQQIILHLENYKNHEKHFDATLSLQAIPREVSALKTFLRFPLMTHKVVAAIYWQALKLWLKGVSFYSHPKEKD